MTDDVDQRYNLLKAFGVPKNGFSTQLQIADRLN